MDSKLTLGAAGYIRAVGDFVFVEDAPEQADIIFVPGASRPEHALRAAELYQAGLAPYVLPSGGFPKTAGRFLGVKERFRAEYPGEFETEWAFLKEVLTRRGVPEEAVLREDRATYTWENALLSREVTDRMGLKVRTAILCCKSFHARRALLYYQAAYPETRFLVCPAQLPGYGREDWYLTEKGRAVVMGEVARLGEQVRDVFTAMLETQV
ncbi:MAG: YdcF family protein [Christensenellaceae bacterium]|nr:YdcF family protein [Christensenellaceae bacterium]